MPCCRSGERELHAGAARALARTGSRECTRASARPRRELRVRMRVRRATLLDEPLGELRRAWSETSYRMRRLRDDPAVRGRGVRRPAGPDATPASAHGTELRPAAGHCRAVHRPRRAAARGGAARAGGQQPGRDGGGARSRRLRRRRRAHDATCSPGARRSQDFARPGGLRRIFLRRRAGRRRRLGASRSCSTRARATSSRRFFARPDTLRARRLQRLPDDGAAARADSRGRALAALPAQPQRAVRGALQSGGECSQSPSVLLAGMAGSRLPIAIAHGEGRREFARPGGRCATASTAGLCRRALPRQPRRAGAALSGQSQRRRRMAIAALTTPDGRVTITMPHPGTRLPHGAELLAPAQRGRGQRLDAPVPQRARVLAPA